MIEEILVYLLPTVINIVSALIIQSKMLKTTIDLKNKNLYIGILFTLIFIIFNRLFIDGFLRFLISVGIMLIMSKIIFKEKTYKLLSVVILQQALMFLAELISVVILNTFKINLLVLSYSNFIGTLIVNIIVSLIAIALYSIPRVSNLCEKIISYLNNISGLNKYLLILLFVATLNILLMFIYFSSNHTIIIIINTVFIFIYSFIAYLLINAKNENIKYKEENKSLLENLNEYEKMLDYQRVANHENKNQLLVIKTMASKNNKKLHDYIDEVIKEKREDNEILYTSAKRIPSGGLQGLVYQKMLLMQERNISIDLNVSKEIRKVELSKLDAKTNFDICRVMGIIIDNAIDEVNKLKDKEISISMYRENDEFIIETANKCKEIPDLDKIDNKGYTTKETGHG